MKPIQQMFLEKFGAKTEITACMEECAELIAVLSRYYRYDKEETAVTEIRENVLDEYVDVLVTLGYIKEIIQLSNKEVADRTAQKIHRMERWLEADSIEQSTRDRSLTDA